MSDSFEAGVNQEINQEIHEEKAPPVINLESKSKNLKANRGLKIKAVVIFLAVILIFAYGSIVNALQKIDVDAMAKKAKKEDYVGTSNAISQLPSTYTPKQPPQVVTPLPQKTPDSRHNLGDHVVAGDLQKYLEERRKRLDLKMEAGRGAPLEFGNVNLQNLYRDRVSAQGDQKSELSSAVDLVGVKSVDRGAGRRIYVLPSGTIIRAALQTAINSDSPGKIVARLTENIYEPITGSRVLLPQGAVLEGKYASQVQWGQSRVTFSFNRLTLPDLTVVTFAESESGTDAAGASGVAGNVNNHYGQLFTGIVLSAGLSSATRIVNGQNSTFDPSFSQLATEGVAQSINNAGQEIIQRDLNIPPTITVSNGAKVAFVTSQALKLKGYF